jgi:hypothetical protein
MGMSDALDDLDEALTQSSKVAASLGDDFLVYMIDMAVLHVRTKALHIDDASEYRPRNSSRRLTKSLKGCRKNNSPASIESLRS